MTSSPSAIADASGRVHQTAACPDPSGGQPVDIIRTAMLAPQNLANGVNYTTNATTMIAAGTGTHTPRLVYGLCWAAYFPNAFSQFRVSGGHTINYASNLNVYFTPGWTIFGGTYVQFSMTINSIGLSTMDFTCAIGVWKRRPITSV